MHLADFSLKKPITIFMIFIGTLILGIISLSKLPVELMPNINLGRVTVTTYVRGGLPSEEVEERISKTMEEGLGDTGHLRNILTISKEGESRAVLEFEPEANMNYVSLEIREKLAKMRDKLPGEAERPIVTQYGYGEFPIIAVTFISEKINPEELRKLVDKTFKERFLRIEGVARIETVGGREEKIIIELDEKKLVAYKISLQDLLERAGTSNINLAGGNLSLLGKDYLVRSVGEFSTLEDVKNLGIKATPEGSIIRLKDIATVELSYLEPREMGRINLKPSVTLYIFKKSLCNTLKVCDEVNALSEDLRVQLKDQMKIIVPFNQGEFITKAINQLRNSLLIGASFAILILLLFLKDFPAILILSLSLPFSVFITFSFMRLFNITLNVMSLAGLCLGGGMLLDSSIVVMENIFKRHEKKEIIEKDEVSASTKEVSLAIIASVITTLIVFLPFIFLNKETQRLYSGLSLSISFSLIGSLFVSLSLIPVLSYILLRKGKKIQRVFFTKVQNGYKKSLNFILSLRYIIVGLAIIGAASTFFLSLQLEKEFIGMPEEDKFTIFVQMPTGTRIEITDKTVRKVESFIEKYRNLGEVKSFTTHIEPYSAKIYVQLASIENRKKEPAQIIELLRENTAKLDPAFIYYEEPQEVESKEIILEFLGYDYSILKDLSKQAAAAMQGIEGLTDVKIRMREGGPQIDIVLDQGKLALWGLNTKQISTELHGKLRGLIPTRFHPKSDTFLTVKESSKPNMLPLSKFSQHAKEIELVARLHEKHRKKFNDLGRLTLIADNKAVTLSQISDFEVSISPSEIWRKNKKRMIQVSANKGKLPLSRVADNISEKLKDLKLPEGYIWKFGETYYKMLRNQKELRLAFIFALVLVYMVLASLFENIFQPFIILASIPLAGIGSVSLLYLKKEPLGIGALIGGIMLAGIVVNNGIILVDYINRLRKEKYSLRIAILEASALRLRPILMTTSTTILPLLPLLIFKTDASPLWAPLAMTVASGLLVSCILTLYVTPCLYLSLHGRGRS